jgi:hypothetical protein
MRRSGLGFFLLAMWAAGCGGQTGTSGGSSNGDGTPGGSSDCEACSCGGDPNALCYCGATYCSGWTYPGADAGDASDGDGGTGDDADSDAGDSTGWDSPLCSAPLTGEVFYDNQSELDALVVGRWLRCGGPIQPVGGPPAPDGQFGLEFMHQFGTGDAMWETRSLWGLIPDNRPDSSLGDVLVWTGGGYGVPSWTFAFDGASRPGIAFSGGLDFSNDVFDPARFFQGGDVLVLSDSIWDGTYVRFR